MIQEKYIDWRIATIKAIKDYPNMEYVLQASRGLASDLMDRMTKPGGSNTDRQPVSGGGSRTEDNWAYCIDKLDVVEFKQAKAVAYMKWFKPAWAKLTEEERIVLEEHYMIQRMSGKWEESACNRLHVERATVYRIKDRAIDRLATLLYGP